MIAASKMRRCQESNLATRPYANKMREVLSDLAAQPRDETTVYPLLQAREVKKIEIIHITADRGLCGGLNANMNRMTASFVLSRDVPVTLVTVGRRGRDFMARYGRDIRAEFTGLGDQPSLADTQPISRVVIDDYISGEADLVLLAYTKFFTTVTQRQVMEQLLPIEPAKIEPIYAVGYIYEPSSSQVLEQLLPRYVEMEVFHAVLESIASEQSARMVAMRNATEAAEDMIQDLTLAFNKARQETITKELLDISVGAMSIS